MFISLFASLSFVHLDFKKKDTSTISTISKITRFTFTTKAWWNIDTFCIWITIVSSIFSIAFIKILILFYFRKKLRNWKYKLNYHHKLFHFHNNQDYIYKWNLHQYLCMLHLNHNYVFSNYIHHYLHFIFCLFWLQFGFNKSEQ